MADSSKDRRWTVLQLTQAAAERLRENGVDNPRLDADLLLADAFGCDRLDLYTRFDMPVDDDVRQRFRDAVRRRLRREPLAYIRGRRGFLEHEFEVGPGVLIPRPETEQVVERAEAACRSIAGESILEVGVGSGCIVVSLLLRLPDTIAVGVDVSPIALEYTHRNAVRFGVRDRLRLVEGDVFELRDGTQLASGVALIVSNPPYVRVDEATSLMPEVGLFEPGVALFDRRDSDGFGFHRRILRDAPKYLVAGGSVVLELPGGPADHLVAEIDSNLWSVEVAADLAGRERVLSAKRLARPG